MQPILKPIIKSSKVISEQKNLILKQTSNPTTNTEHLGFYFDKQRNTFIVRVKP